jgi:plasmanylethanolamine desaturase
VLGTYDYPTSHRVFEIISVAAFITFAGALAWRVVDEVSGRMSWPIAALIVALILAAYAVADLASGIVHYLLDNFGSPETPVIGQKFVKPFRDHHTDPMAMTHGDFIAVNADNVFVCLPVIIPAFFFLEVTHHPYAGVFIIGLVGGVIMTNQLHKWAHMPSVPRLLSKEHHSVHHSGAYDSNYCITWGHLDMVLNRVVARHKRQHG